MTNQAMPTAAAPVRFSNQSQNTFTKTLRKRVDAYFKDNQIDRYATIGMKVKTIVLLSFYLLPFLALLFFTPSLGISLLIWLIMGIAVAGIGMAVMHDANHGAYSRNPRVNLLVGHTLNLLGGAVCNWKTQHNVLHHTYTNIAGKDNDIDGAGTLRFHPHGEAKKHHKHQWLYAFGLYSILTLFWAVGKDFIQFYRYKEQRKPHATPSSERRLFAKIVVMKFLYFAVLIGIPVFVAGIAFWQVLVGFLIMHAVGGVILALIFQLAHVVEDTDFPLPDASGSMEDSFLVHQLRTTANFSTHSAVLTWYCGGLNHQVEHHLFPNICHVHYPAIAPIVKATAEEFGVPYHHTDRFTDALASHIRMLKKFGLPKLDEIGA